MYTDDKSRINALTSTRAIAAVLVVMHHFASDLFPYKILPVIFHSGNIAVSYFFVLSGFVLYLSHANRYLSYFNYLRRRVARIAPLYYFGLLLTVLPYLSGIQQIPDDIGKQMIYSVLFIQSYIPGYATTLNLPGWSLCAEMAFYLIFPFLLSIQQKKTRLFIIAGICVFIITQCAQLHYFPIRKNISGGLLNTLSFNPVIHINQFIVGMMGGYIYQRIKDIPFKAHYLPAVIFGIIILMLAIRPENINYSTGLIAPLFALLIVVIAMSRLPVLSAPLFVFAGEISYGIYILQHPVFLWFELFNNKYHVVSADCYFYVGFIALIIVSVSAHYLLERPLRRLIGGSK